RPSAPTIRARVPRYSISEEALERLPHLSFRRWMKKGLRVPSASERGTKKQVSPASVRARVKKASLIGAEQNHLCPESSYSPPPRGTARDELARRSEPPCLSVIAMPVVTARLLASVRGRGS